MTLNMNNSFEDFHTPQVTHFKPSNMEDKMRIANATSPMAMHKVNFKLPEGVKKGAHKNDMKSNYVRQMAVNEMGMQNFSQMDDGSVGMLYSSRSREGSTNMLPALEMKSSANNTKMQNYSSHLHPKPFDSSTIIVENQNSRNNNSKLFNRRHPSVSVHNPNKINPGQ